MGNRRPKGIGIDTASIDYGQSSDFKTHQIMGKNNVWGLENLNNLNGLPHNNFEIFNMVHKLREGSGGPSRVIAVLHPATLSSANTQEISVRLITVKMTFLAALSTFQVI